MSNANSKSINNKKTPNKKNRITNSNKNFAEARKKLDNYLHDKKVVDNLKEIWE